MDPSPGDLRQRTEQTDSWAVVWFLRRLDRRSIWTTSLDARGYCDGWSGADRFGKYECAMDVLFLLPAERAGLRLRGASAKPGVVDSLVRQVAWQGNGFCLSWNWFGRTIGFSNLRSTS